MFVCKWYEIWDMRVAIQLHIYKMYMNNGVLKVGIWNESQAMDEKEMNKLEATK